MTRVVLVVCVGNICRSPMAMGLLGQSLPGFIVRSAGLDAMPGTPVDPLAAALCADAGIDLSGHRAHRLTGRDVAGADLVLTMNDAQKHSIQLRYPQCSGHVYRLGERTGCNIPDPHGLQREAFVQAFSCIRAGVDDWAPRIGALD